MSNSGLLQCTGENMGRTVEYLLHQWEAGAGTDLQSPNAVL